MSIVSNYLKTALLLGLLTGLALVIGQIIGGRSGLIIALIIALCVNFFSFWFSDKIAIMAYGAKLVSKTQNPKLHEIVEEIASKAHIPKPKIYIINSATPNAFATGRSPKHSAVAATTGILNLLNERELKGVIAHEIAHIKNRDILISSIAAAMAGIIATVASMARWAAIFGGFRDDRNGSNILELLVLAIVTPIIALLIQMAISRSREFSADATGASFTKDPHALAEALAKLESGISAHPMQANGTTQATAHMFIANPFSAKSIMGIFSTHPPLELRIQKLRRMRF